MDQDLTVAVHAGTFDYQARLLNDGSVRVFLEGALVGTAFWDGTGLVDRSSMLADSIYDALGAALAIELAGATEPDWTG